MDLDATSYVKVIENAFRFYENKLIKEIEIEKLNSNNYQIIKQINLIVDSLKSIQAHYVTNIHTILKNGNIPTFPFDNMDIFINIMDTYYKDLERGISLIQKNYNSVNKKIDILNEECKLINTIMYNIGIKQ